MKLDTFLPVLRGRRKLVFWVFFAVAAAGTIVNFWIPKQYTSSATLLVDNKSGSASSLRSLTEGIDARFMREQLAYISSYGMALRVIENLGLEKSTEVRSLYRGDDAAMLGHGSFRGWLAELLLSNLRVTASTDSNVLEIQFTAADPRLAAAVVNAFVQSYSKAIADNQSNSSKRQLQFVQRQLADLRGNVNSLERNIAELQQQDGYVAIGERFAAENRKLQEIGARLVAAPEASARQLREDFDAQKLKVDAIQAKLSKLRQLQSDLETMQRSREFATQRYWQESFNERPEVLSVVTLRAAEVPEEPSLPKLWINLPLAVLLGLIFGAVVALLAEVVDRRIRTEAEASEVLDLPVLATVAL